MKVLKELFKPSFDLPYYIPCMSPAVHEQLKRIEVRCRLSLLLNLTLVAVPCLLVNKDRSLTAKTSLWESKQLGYFNSYNYLGVEVIRENAGSFKDGLEILKTSIENQELFIAAGTSYYLNYSSDYLDENYIRSKTYENPNIRLGNHWLSVYGYDKNHISVYDPKPWKFMGEISVSDFKLFWKGDRNIPQINNELTNHLRIFGYAYIRRLDKSITTFNLDELFFMLLKTIAVEFKEGNIINDTYYFGKSYYAKTIEELQNFLNGDIDFESFNFFYYQCLHELKFSKYFFRDLLLDYEDLLNSINLNIISDYIETIKLLENSLVVLYVRVSRDKINSSDAINEFIKTFIKLESMDSLIFEKIAATLSNIRVLPKKIIV